MYAGTDVFSHQSWSKAYGKVTGVHTIVRRMLLNAVKVLHYLRVSKFSRRSRQVMDQPMSQRAKSHS